MNRTRRTIMYTALTAVFAVLFGFFMSMGVVSVQAQVSNSAPSLTGVDNISISICDDSFDPMDGVSATDPDGDVVGISVSGDNVLDEALSDDDAGTYTLTYTADDNNGGFDIVDRTVTVEDEDCGTGGPGAGNSAPSLTGIDNVTVTSCPSTFDALAGVSATDPDGDAVEISVDGENVLNDALADSDEGTYILTYTAEDGNGGFDIADRTVTVDCAPSGGGGGAGNSAPSVTGIDNVTITSCPSTFDALAGVSATDPDGDAVEISVDGENVLNDALADSEDGTYTLTYTAEDGNGGFDIVNRTVTVDCEDGDNGDDDDDDDDGRGGGGRCINCDGDDDDDDDVDRPEPRVLGTCVYLNDFLRIDFNNDPIEVIKLQLFLKTFEGFSNLEATGVFDNATLQAVNQFQMRYSDQVLNPWGYADDQPTGYVYITTKKQINEIFCNRSFPLTAAQQQEIAAFRSLLQSTVAAHRAAQPQVSGADTDDWKVGVGNRPEEDTVAQATTTPTTTPEEPDRDDDDDNDDVVVLDEHTRTPLQNTAAAIYSGLDNIFDFLGSTGLLILILGIILGWLLTEWYKGHRERKGQKDR